MVFNSYTNKSMGMPGLLYDLWSGLFAIKTGWKEKTRREGDWSQTKSADHLWKKGLVRLSHADELHRLILSPFVSFGRLIIASNIYFRKRKWWHEISFQLVFHFHLYFHFHFMCVLKGFPHQILQQCNHPQNSTLCHISKHCEQIPGNSLKHTVMHIIKQKSFPFMALCCYWSALPLYVVA